MKQELPFAVALLAAGCLLCSSQFTESSKSNPSQTRIDQPESENSTVTNNANQIPAKSNQSSFVSAGENQVATVGFEEAIGETEASTNSPEPRTDFTRSTKDFLHAGSNQQAVEFLASVSNSISNSQPLSTTIQMTGNMFGEVVSATGVYYQMGQGTNQSRIELNFGMLANSPRAFQLCDGRFVYKLQTDGDKKELEFVDLLQIRETAQDVGGITPTGWVATGGVSSLFQHLASAFNFGEPTTIDDSKVMLRGSWDETALRMIIESSEFELELHSPMTAKDWSRLPGQMPHAVELVLQKDETLGYFPKRVSFLKLSSTNPVPIVTMNFSPPQALIDSPGNPVAAMFVINAANLESVDVTERYLTRIKSFDEKRRTAMELNQSLSR